jgi:hypothetical protein
MSTVSKVVFATRLRLLRLLEEEGYGCGVLQEAACRGGRGAGDCDGVGLGGEGEGVGGADAVSAAGSEEWGQAEEGEGD